VPEPARTDPPSAATRSGGGPGPGLPTDSEQPTELAALLSATGLRLEISGRRADVVLAAARRRNVQTPATWRALAAAGAWLAGRADVVVIRAEGPTFCAGLDRRAFTPAGIPGEFSIAELVALDDPDLDARIAVYQEGFAVWSDGPFLTIAAVQGHAVGAGFQLALACDLRVAADDAQFSIREPAFGIVPDLTGTHPLVAAVGQARALEICATTRWVPAAEAGALGLVQSVVPVDRLAAATDELVAAVLANSMPAVLATREVLRGAARRTPQEQRAVERAAQVPRLRALARGER
jgi:enoyl-CoA hydratase/carnithine racemase